MNIIVLCGGLSLERDVSLKSGTLIAAALKQNGHRAVLVDSFFGYTGSYDRPEDIFEKDQGDAAVSINEDIPDLQAVKAMRNQDNDSSIGDNLVEVCRAADIVFMALHGSDGESGKLQALFDIEGIRYTGCGSLGSVLAMNKEVAKKIFQQSGILTPDGFAVNIRQEKRPEPTLPCVVKPRSGGSSVGTSIANTAEEYHAALDMAFRFEDWALVERYVKGREVDVGVIMGRALPPIEICPKSGFFDYKNKYQSGMTDEICPADFSPELTERLKQSAVDVYNALMLEIYARMDFIVDENGDIWCLEANTLPGMTPTSLLPQEAAADGIDYNSLCELIITESLKKYR
ncbi:MAG: D-alanine--D-alanine ligase [Oscillospiraceae bacterium]|nr:D-alanine--D-alanine ligase [Oscillospiraceae bacterium]